MQLLTARNQNYPRSLTGCGTLQYRDSSTHGRLSILADRKPHWLRLITIATLLVFQILATSRHNKAFGQPYSGVPRSNSPTPASILQYAFRPIHADASKQFPRMPGEFESQRAILLSVSDLMYQHNRVLTQIVEKTSRRVPLVILFNDDKQLLNTVELLDAIDCDLTHVSFYNLKLDTIWLRDFGPRLVETPTGAMSLDFFYDGQRPLDDKFPISWGRVSNATVNEVKWTLHGGNMLSNGKGLAIASSRLFEDNFIAFPNPTPGMNVDFERRKIVVDAFKQDCNINQLLILESPQPEATRHVDMFAAFLAPDQVLVAQLDPRVDPANAKVLDDNARLLAQVRVGDNPMRVERIRIPPRNGKYWSPYTNILFANNLLLMPVYQSDPPALVQNAINQYRKLLPGVAVDTVDMTTMQKLEGALHCMTVNVPAFAELPQGMISFADARQRLQATGYVSKRSPLPIGNDLVDSIQNERLATQHPVERGEPRPIENRDSAARGQADEEPDPVDTHLDAVATYRRTFVDQSRKFTVDAYVVGIAAETVALIRVDNERMFQVEIDILCAEDKLWLSRNAEKIRRHGDAVRLILGEK